MKKSKLNDVNVVGGGLAGSEAAWQLAQLGFTVHLFEMRPKTMTPAHVSGKFGELVCSNSLGSTLGLAPATLLKDEMRLLDSLIIKAGESARVPAGSALAVDREAFSQGITEVLEDHPNIVIHHEVVSEILSGPTVIATGPLTHESLTEAISDLVGAKMLSFFDAAAPIVLAESVDMNHAFWGSREGNQDYLNCPLTKDEYMAFYDALIHAEQHMGHDFESAIFFEGCLPIEELARRGVKTPLYGPMKPIGLENPFEQGRRPYAVVQLRRDNAAGSLMSLVGFQTNLRWGEQKRVFGLIPALHDAEFVRYGVMHRNTYLKSPAILRPTLNAKVREDLWFAGQMTGVEGYVESAATGIMVARYIAQWLEHGNIQPFPRDTMMGALAYYITHTDPEHFQPMNANFGLLNLPPEIQQIHDKKARRRWLRDRALSSLKDYLEHIGVEVSHHETR
ncbi:methylenetetrahydrofolate--tRNA-(uracil(54)-C(5))-methyltransferase (FADH(2)-oxidizing) TrmFO [Sulfobacillus thermosulfidooxidans]|uniref:methylenetetrahydrofolate--tRNA-(uracil(54)- C(5))-methyltransferase (FADH(2)-oxidizing) TrmFO n=1 Tax=Sulfobacillus thermosulfidooxidans TaxID=28034 RepID=UPI00041327D2|nr:methylenetetrahydrofolate--tRNA-(uracil(54)-C(5))-methyltransferase (FADH(2)-oxidizing) TrmFO [Sulfobacillus thermosulfidooxidans]